MDENAPIPREEDPSELDPRGDGGRWVRPKVLVAVAVAAALAGILLGMAARDDAVPMPTTPKGAVVAPPVAR